MLPECFSRFFLLPHVFCSNPQQVWYTIYHHLPVVKGVSSKPSFFINQPMGIWDIAGRWWWPPTLQRPPSPSMASSTWWIPASPSRRHAQTAESRRLNTGETIEKWGSDDLTNLTIEHRKNGDVHDLASGGKTAPVFWPFLKTHIFYLVHAHRTLQHWVGGVGMLTFMLTCVTCTSYVTSPGWVCVGMLKFMLTCVTCTSYVTSPGWGGVGMLTFMLTCVTCTSDVTSLGGGYGDVNVHVNLRHMHIVRYVTGLGGWGC